MAKYTNTFTAPNGIVTNSVLDTATNTQTITVTAPSGQVATTTVDPGDVEPNFDNIITNLSRQLNEGGGDIGLRGVVSGVSATSRSVTQQKDTATGVARVTGNPPPAAPRPPTPSSNIADPEIPAPVPAVSSQPVETTTPASSTPIAVAYPQGTLLFNSQNQFNDYNANPGEYALAFVGSGYVPVKIETPNNISQTATGVENPPDPQEQAEWDSPALVPTPVQEQEQAEWDSPPAVTDAQEEDTQEFAEWDSPPAVTDDQFEPDPQEQAEWDSPPAVTDDQFEPDPQEQAEWDSPPAVTDAQEEDPQEQAEWDSPPAVTDDVYQTDPQEQAEWDLNPEQVAAAQEAGIQRQAREQQTLAARLKTPSNGDWRVRISLADNSDYLYNDTNAVNGVNTILAPLKATNGVIFPYTPTIETNYRANYDTSDLIHSNYRGYFYKNSYVDAVQVRGTFTAQDTKEASYLLAVIHFFKSVTKMFYGQDPAYRGSPPPLVYLNGLGQYQFSNHPCLVSTFTYSLPNDVDYVRVDPNNYGLNMLAQKTPAFTGAGNLLSAIKARLTSVGGIPVGAFTTPGTQSTVNQTVNTLSRATYVPTKMEISITLLPVQSRRQISQQFSLKNFANGAGLKGGFW